ncbi:putative disease resistance RPP13-like protein 1 [Arachis hypogaea]|nr:putative disease resistance RPP13-like protein 1 [Arachis hypogaea]QHN99809.1 Putative disease resistance RPP13-like protein [Arachis hypogaea]
MVAFLLSAFVQALLQVLLDRLASRQILKLFRQKISAANEAQAAAEKLKFQLLSVNTVLDDAEEKQIVNPYVKIWLDELREVIYKAQDVLDQIALEVDRSYKAMDRVREFLHITNKLTSSLVEINSRIQILRDQKDCLGLKEQLEKRSSLYSSGTDLLYVPTTRIVDESKVFGRDNDKKQIIQKMKDAMEQKVEPVCVVAIVGMAGVGKTTLSQLLFNDGGVVQMFDTLSWVQVSGESDVVHLTKKVCGSVSESLDALQVQLNEKLKTQRMLLVLDDFWSLNSFDWDLFKMVFANAMPGSVILATMRNKNVADTMHAAVTYPLSPLYKNCWDIFAYYAFGNRSPEPDTSDPALVEIGKRIATKCKGLPLAAKVLGSLLRSVTDVGEWNNILQSKMWDLPANKSNILPALRLSYQLLPSYLKACFAYCSLFPKGYDIDKQNLIHLWMAEGFLQPSKTKTMHRVGEEYLQELLSRSLLQRSTKSESCVAMHDLISDLAQYVGGEFFHSIEEGNFQMIPEKVRHLSFSKGLPDKPPNYFSQLRTFLSFREANSSASGALTNQFFYGLIPTFERVRVLSLPDYPISTLHSIGHMKHLRYLNLSGTMIEELPEFASSLYHLQILLLSNCVYLKSLPKDMENLTDLLQLDVTGAPLKEMPPNFGRLKLLRHLTTFVVSESARSSITELGALSQLHGSLSIVNLQYVNDGKDALGANLIEKTFLDELVLKWTKTIHDVENEAITLYNLKPCTNLKKLEIENYGGNTFPDWLGNPSFSNLVSVKLIHCSFCLSLPPLGQLSSMKTLLIEKMTWLETVDFEFYGNRNSPFRSLETLTFKNMPSWKKWLPSDDVQEHFPSLKELHILSCPKFAGNLPQHLGSLEKLVIVDCSIVTDSLPRVPLLKELELTNCNSLVSLPEEMMWGNQQMTKVTICNCQLLQSLRTLEHVGRLELLHINECRELVLFSSLHDLHRYQAIEALHLKDSCHTLQVFLLSSFGALQDLHIQGCPNLQSLEISSDSTENLSHLKKVQLKDCPKLVSFPSGGFPTNLQELSICNCDELLPEAGSSLRQMTSLAYLEIKGKLIGLDSFPDGGLLPSCLTDLHIIGFEDLKSLSHAGLQHLVSLKSLMIESCKKLDSLPAEGLPASLSKLDIVDCPLLAPLCQPTGSYWSLISHIRDRNIVRRNDI